MPVILKKCLSTESAAEQLINDVLQTPPGREIMVV
jgi:hypothetical protein